MNDEIQLRDQRRKGWYHIDNEICKAVSIDALVYYNHLAMRAGQDQKGYVSKTGLANQYGSGRHRWVSAEKELISAKLIAPTGEYSQAGIPIFALLDIRSAVLAQHTPCASTAHPPVLAQHTPCAGTAHKQNPTKTNKTKPKKNPESSDFKKVQDLFVKANEKLTGEPMHWKGGQYGKAIKDMIKLGEKASESKGIEPFEYIRAKCTAYWQMMHTDPFYKKQGFTPSSVLSAWNKIEAVRVPEKRVEKTYTPEEEAELFNRLRESEA